MKEYRIAIYIRLSKPTFCRFEDDKIKEESNSVTMQRILLHKYVADKFSDYELSEFCDDGYTGTNFERPGMQKLLEKVRDMEIDCIIVKDFSRFARDYIELGSYLEQIFPFMGVRFISVNDHYDSKTYQGSIADIDINFKNLLYDLYSKDLSQKVRSSLAIRKEQGQYISGNSPFGYEKDPKDRHALLIAEDEAKVVRKIFSLTVEGYTSTQIARLFNENRVKTPIEFKIEKGKTTREPKGERFLWSTSAICQILRNEIYIGNIVQKKYEKDFVGGKNHIKPREEWMVGYNHHEPIIEKEVFYQVQEGRGKFHRRWNQRNPQHRKTHPLTGKLVCGCCKRNLHLKYGLNPYFNCSNRYSNAMKNCVDKVNMMFLEQYILYKMQEKLETDGEAGKLHADMLSQMQSEVRELKAEREQLKGRIQKIKKQKFEAYEDYVSGKSADFHSNEVMVKSMEDELKIMNEKIQKMEDSYTKLMCEQDSLWAGSDFAELSKQMLDHYIEKVVVYDEQHMEIFWKEK